MKKFFTKPEVLYLGLLSLALNLGFNFELTYLSSILKFFGAQNRELSFLWLAPPVTGLLVQPLIGQISDATTAPHSKRRPYLMVSGILTVLTFLLIPYVHSLFYAVVWIWVLNATMNGCLAMWRALITDLSPPEERAETFAFHTFCAAIGSTIGAALPYLTEKLLSSAGQSLFSEKSKLPSNLQLSFIICAVVLGLILFICMLKVKEPSHYDIVSLDEVSEEKLSLFKSSIKIFSQLGKNLKRTSSTFKKYCLFNSAISLAMFILWVYFVLALAQNFYSLPLGISEENIASQASSILQQATLDSSRYLTISQLSYIVYTLFLSFLLKHIDRVKLFYGVSLLIGGAGVLMIGFAHTPAVLVIAMIGVGIVNGSYNVLAFLIISHIFPKGKTAVYYGLFNVSLTSSQVMGALTLSPIYLYLFQRHASYMIFLAGTLVLISAVLWIREAFSRRTLSLA